MNYMTICVYRKYKSTFISYICIDQYLSKKTTRDQFWPVLAVGNQKPFIFEGVFQHFPVKKGHQERLKYLKFGTWEAASMGGMAYLPACRP